MNFRHLDPRDERAGMSGASEADARVWDEFFDKMSGELRVDELEAEFNRLWGQDGEAVGADPELQNEALTETVRALEEQTLSTLIYRYNKEVNSRPKRPRASAATGRVFERSALVIAIARLRAHHRCEVPDCQHPMFVCVDGTRYSEVHHIVPLADGGETAADAGTYYGGPFETAAHSLLMEPIAAPVHNAAEIEGTLGSYGHKPGIGLVIMPDGFTNLHRELIISLAARYSVPAIYPFRYMVAEGGLMSYGVDLLDLYPRAASYVDRILKGEKPADLPVQLPTKFELVVNLKTAEALGMKIPESFLARADEAIE